MQQRLCQVLSLLDSMEFKGLACSQKIVRKALQEFPYKQKEFSLSCPMLRFAFWIPAKSICPRVQKQFAGKKMPGLRIPSRP